MRRPQSDWPDGCLADYVLLPASSVVIAEGFEHMETQLAAGETMIVNGATGAYGGAAVLLAFAMGAGRVVAAGRNAAKLDALARIAGKGLATVMLSGDVQADAAALRDAAGGGAEIAFDMVGASADPGSTLAALNALRRGGRLVLMGGMTMPAGSELMLTMLPPETSAVAKNAGRKAVSGIGRSATRIPGRFRPREVTGQVS